MHELGWKGTYYELDPHNQMCDIVTGQNGVFDLLLLSTAISRWKHQFSSDHWS